MTDHGPIPYEILFDTYRNAYVADHWRAFSDLAAELQCLPEEATEDEIQTQVYEIGKQHFPDELREWFRVCYLVFIGKESGPRLGQLIKILGRQHFIDDIQQRLKIVEHIIATPS